MSVQATKYSRRRGRLARKVSWGGASVGLRRVRGREGGVGGGNGRRDRSAFARLLSAGIESDVPQIGNPPFVSPSVYPVSLPNATGQVTHLSSPRSMRGNKEAHSTVVAVSVMLYAESHE